MLKSVSSYYAIHRVFRFILIFIIISSFFTAPARPVIAAANLTITPITWNVVGLDSNNVKVGPNIFPVGARVCNTGGTTVTNLVSKFNWGTGSDANINLRNFGTTSEVNTLTYASLAAGACTDFYYEVEINRSTSAFDTSRTYNISVSADSQDEVTTVEPREIYVEHLISQNRNSTNKVSYGTNSSSLTQVSPGGIMSLVLGQTYYIKLEASTATQGYNQLEDFINFPNTVFQILSVNTTYTANSSGYVANPNSLLYADACLWDMDPTSDTYLSCIGSDGKSGGSIQTLYQVKIIGGVGDSEPLNTLIYDFSGSSFHYNSDFSTSGWTITVSTPLNVSKSFSPTSIASGATSILSIAITNGGSSSVSGVSLTDTLPTGVTVSSPGTSTVCGGTLTTANSSPSTIALSGATIPTTGCTIQVVVTSSTNGTYVNTTGPLKVNSVSTGLTASANLVVETAPSGTCTPITIAQWTISNTTRPPLVTTKDGNVTALAFWNGADTSPNTTWWRITDPTSSTTVNIANEKYFGFQIDTTQYTNVKMNFSYTRGSTGPTGLDLYYGNSQTISTTTPINPVLLSGAQYVPTASTQNASNIDFTGLTNTAGSTYFFLYAYKGASNQGTNNWVGINNISFTGCRPAQTVEKTFTPDTIIAGGTSTLSISLKNYDSIAASSMSFNDTLPVGLKISSASPTSDCGGTLTATQNTSVITLANGSIPAKPTGQNYGECTISVTVTGSTSGVYDNLSSYLTKSGTPLSSRASDSLTIIEPPEITKSFSTNPIYPGQTSLLTFRITNPNPLIELTGVHFTDTFPANLLVSGTPITDCASATLTYASNNNVTLSGATIPAGGYCTVSAYTTSSVSNTNPGYANSVTVSSTNGGTGNTAEDTLVVQTVHPGISILKEVSTSSSGPWAKYISVAPGDSVYYRITIENTGDVPLSPVSISDTTDVISSTLKSEVETAAQGCNTKWPTVLPVASATVDPTASCIIGPFNSETGTKNNTASASGTYNNKTYTSPASTAEEINKGKATYSTTSLVLSKNIVSSQPATSPVSFSAAGNVINYSYSITNYSDAPLTGNLSFFDSNIDTFSCAGGTITISPTDDPVSVTLGAHNSTSPSDTITCTASYTVSNFDVSVGSITNTAYATIGTTKSNMDRATVFGAGPDLVVSKTNDVQGYAVKGTAFNWTIAVSNQGPTAANFLNTNVILSDTLPDGATYAVSTPDPITNVHCSISLVTAHNVLTCSATGAVTAAASSTFFSVIVATTPTIIGSLQNAAATVDPSPSNITESNEGNNSMGDSVNVTANADLSITKTDGVTAVSPGGLVTYTIIVSNAAGSSSADGAIFTDPAVLGLTVTSVSCGSANLATCPTTENTTIALMQGVGIVIPTLSAGGSVTFTVTGTAASSGSIENSAYINPPSGVVDTNLTNNASTDLADTISVIADLAVTKTDGVTSIDASGTATTTYTLRVTNNGPSAVTGAVLKDTLGSGLTATGVACTSTSSNTCGAELSLSSLTGPSGLTLPALALNAFYEFTLSANVTATTGSVANSATVTPPAGTSDPTSGNDTVTDTDTINPVADLVVTKTDGKTSIIANGSISTTYTIHVTNNGPSAVTGAVLKDTLGSGLTATGVACTSTSSNTCGAELSLTNLTGSSGITLPALEVSAFYEFTLSADITATSGTITNSATVTLPSGTSDPTPTNNTDTDTTSIVAGSTALTIEKSAVQSIFSKPDYELDYTYVVTNSGNVRLAFPVTVTDDKTTVTCQSFTLVGNGDAYLDPNEAMNCSASYSTTQQDVDHGSVKNTAYATSGSTKSNEVSVTVPAYQDKNMSVVKSSTLTEVTSTGQSVPYKFSVTNSGNVTLTGVTISDSNCTTAVTPTPSSINPGESKEFTCSHTVTKAEMIAGGVLSNTVKVDSNETNEVSDSLDIPIIQSPELTVTKTSTTDSISKAGDVVPYTFTVENTGTQTLTEITVIDSKCSSDISLKASDATADAKMQAGEIWIYTCNYQVQQSDLNASNALLSNTVTVDSKESAQAQDTLTIFITQTPGLSLTKTAEETSFSKSGDILHYTLTAKNTGNVGLTNVSITDVLLGTLDCTPAQPAVLAPEESLVCTGTHTVDNTDLAAGYFKNTADATGTPPVGDTLTPKAELTTNAASKLGLAKELVSTAKVDGVAGTWDVQFKFYIRNYENIAISALQITDDLAAAFPSPAEIKSVILSDTTLHINSSFNGTTDKNLLTGEDTLAGNGSATITMTVRLVPAAGEYSNTAMVSGEDPDHKVVGDTSQSGSNPDPDNTGAPGDHSSPTTINFNGNIFDPPSGTKVYDDSGLPAILWTMEWINDSNVLAIDAEVLDPIPAGSKFKSTGASSGYPVPGGAPANSTNVGVTCTDDSAVTFTTECYFEWPTATYPQGRIIWKGTIGPETDPTKPENSLKIQYFLTIDSNVKGINNVASINVDLNGDGTIDSGSETDVVEAAKVWGTISEASSTSITPTPLANKKMPETGFAPDIVTLLPRQPMNLFYRSMGGLVLEIPKIGVDADIVGVPLNSSTGEWDVTWLSDQLGWLNGTEFPSGSGNSVITGHVYLPSGLPGPFKDLGTLKWGDRVILHNQGRQFVYEVREVKSVLPGSQAAFKHEEKSWLTLLTCQGYNETTGQYDWRKLVRAVLISVSDE